MSHARIPKSEKQRHARFLIGGMMIRERVSNLVYKWGKKLGAAAMFEPNCLADGAAGYLHVSESFVEQSTIEDVLATVRDVIEHARRNPSQVYEVDAAHAKAEATMADGAPSSIPDDADPTVNVGPITEEELATRMSNWAIRSKQEMDAGSAAAVLLDDIH